MTKKVLLYLSVCVLYLTVNGCSPQMVIGALEGAGHMGGFNNSDSSSNFLLGTETERHNVGKYVVGIQVGFYKSNPGIIFMAYDQGRRTKFVFFEKSSSDDMKMIDSFNRMDEMGKKQQIREWFIKYTKLDLGPVENETAEKSTPSSQDIPITGFAPRTSK